MDKDIAMAMTVNHGCVHALLHRDCGHGVQAQWWRAGLKQRETGHHCKLKEGWREEELCTSRLNPPRNSQLENEFISYGGG